jgi:hypothetical protein
MRHQVYLWFYIKDKAQPSHPFSQSKSWLNKYFILRSGLVAVKSWHGSAPPDSSAHMDHGEPAAYVRVVSCAYYYLSLHKLLYGAFSRFLAYSSTLDFIRPRTLLTRRELAVAARAPEWWAPAWKISPLNLGQIFARSPLFEAGNATAGLLCSAQFFCKAFLEQKAARRRLPTQWQWSFSA